MTFFVRRRPAAALLLCALLAGCPKTFRPESIRDENALFQASLREFEQRRWDNAIAGFEKLTLELAARDPKLPAAFYYLGLAHERRKQHLLAAQSFTRLVESAPGDTLADDALLAAARAYRRLWRKPDLDAQYGTTALETLRTMKSLFPTSSLTPEADRLTAELLEMFARKDFETGMHYYRRRAFDSGLIYFNDVVRNYPETRTARQAWVRIVQSYLHPSMRYAEDAALACGTARQRYPDDAELARVCGPSRPARSAPPDSAAAVTPRP